MSVWVRARESLVPPWVFVQWTASVVANRDVRLCCALHATLLPTRKFRDGGPSGKSSTLASFLDGSAWKVTSCLSPFATEERSVWFGESFEYWLVDEPLADIPPRESSPVACFFFHVDFRQTTRDSTRTLSISFEIHAHRAAISIISRFWDGYFIVAIENLSWLYGRPWTCTGNHLIFTLMRPFKFLRDARTGSHLNLNEDDRVAFSFRRRCVMQTYECLHDISKAEHVYFNIFI